MAKFDSAKQVINIIRRNVGGVKTTLFIKKSVSTPSFGSSTLTIKAQTSKGLVAGKMETLLDKRRALVKDVNVLDSAQGLGISSRLFKETLKDLSRKKVSFLGSHDILHPAQVKIRSKYSSKFVAKYMTGLRAGKVRIGISARKAVNAIKRTRSSGFASVEQVKASTKVPKDFHKTTLTFRRIRGRLVPIRKRHAK